MRKVFLLVISAMLIAGLASAGIHFSSVTRSEGAHPSTMRVEGWAEGDSARIEFREGSLPFGTADGYMITRDGGSTVYLVNPKERTYARIDLEGMLGAVGGIMEAMGPMVRMEFSDPKVERLAEGPGEPILGMPTTHYRNRISYRLDMRVLGRRTSQDTVSEDEVWTTTALDHAGLRAWLRKDPPKTGNEDFDKLISAQWQVFDGFPLKSISVSTTTDQRGESQTTRTVMEVTDLQVVSVSADRFEIPADYTETQLIPMGGPDAEAGEAEDENPLRRLLPGRRRR